MPRARPATATSVSSNAAVRDGDTAHRRDESGAQVGLEVFFWILGLVVALYLLGLIVTWVRLGAARLPGDIATSVLSTGQLFGDGVRSAALSLVAFAVLSGLAYLTATFRWEVNGQDWHDVAKHGLRGARSAEAKKAHETRAEEWNSRPRGLARLDAPPAHAQIRDPAPLGDTAVRIIAGFNLLVIAGLLSLGVARLVESLIFVKWLDILGSAPFLVTWVVFFLIFHQLLTRVNLLNWGPRLHGLPWVVIVVGTLLASAPIGVLVLTGVAISTLGRTVAGRVQRPSSAHDVIHSSLPWILFAIVVLLSLAYNAMPPVSFPSVTVTTTGGRFSGGYLNRLGQGAYFVTCTPLADATSANERVRFVPATDLRSVSVGGSSFSLDSGDRPSLISLGLRALSVNGTVKPLFNADLRPQRGTCGGSAPTRLTAATEDPALGAGVLVQSPQVPVTHAHDGELPIQQTAKPQIAALARKYQPTLLVTVADRFWPVSVNALLADHGPHGGSTCLFLQGANPICGAALTAKNLSGRGDPLDYLRFPVPLTHDFNGVGQFKSFQLGQFINTGPLHSWLANPGRLDPWYTAQIYFFLGPYVTFKNFPNSPYPASKETFLPLEYWFYYPYNYFPLVADAQLMNEAPLAGDELNVDLHQGDWEHMDVLLNASTLAPEWLYMARHANEGQFIQWGSPSLALDHGHPLVQAAIGGHPTYQPGCGAQVRNQPGYVLVDWLACGSGRFAFPAQTTPLVDIAHQPWACWRGHFGTAATSEERKNLKLEITKGESVIEQLRDQIYVAGPLAPPTQGENKAGGCAANPQLLETKAVTRYFASAHPRTRR